MKECTRALLVFLVMTMLTGLAYPFASTHLCQLLFPGQANGSLVASSGTVVGSALIGQKFTRPGYFHGRPAANDYDASNSGGSNFGPSNAKYLEEVGQRAKQVRNENDLDIEAPVPADLVLASASGLDPHISVDGALTQVARVAGARKLSEVQVRALVEKLTEPPFLGLTGDKRINVLKLNLALDELTPGRR